ncbi:MAG TPA: hypothetical protein VMF55_05575 [Solirubrobacterales bacterium]|nr:hypothetical protein [Solirubrobacterales bacterium]
MALSDEQNAMLRLLASGEQGYGDIAALLGLSEDEVRAKVVGALAQLQAEGKPAPDIPPPIPGGAKPAAEAAPPEPEPASPASDAEPGAPAPASPEPAEPVRAEPTAPKSAAPAAAASPSPPSSGSSGPSGGRTVTLPSGRRAWLLGGGIVAAIAAIVVVIILVSGGGGGNSAATGSGAGGSTTGAEDGATESAATGKEPTQAILKPVDGGTASGKATFGVGKLKGKRQLILEIKAEGLSPTAKGESYAVSFAKSSSQVMPMAATRVKADGKIEAATYLPNQIAEYLAAEVFTQVYISRADTKRLTAAMTSSSKSGKSPSYTGEPVLRGTITGPIVGLAKREEGKKGE